MRLRDMDGERVGCFVIFATISTDVFDAKMCLCMVFDMLSCLGCFPAV